MGGGGGGGQGDGRPGRRSVDGGSAAKGLEGVTRELKELRRECREACRPLRDSADDSLRQGRGGAEGSGLRCGDGGGGGGGGGFSTPPPSPGNLRAERGEVHKMGDRVALWVSDERRYRWGPRLELLGACLAEMWGTAVIVLFGCGSVCSALYVESQIDLFGIAAVWGLGVALAVYCSANVSGAHLNPAVSLAFAIFRPKAFPWWRLPWFVLFQMLGGILGGAVNLAIYGPAIRRFEAKQGLVRGTMPSHLSAMAFGEYFPNPGLVQAGLLEPDEISVFGALCVEAWGTFILMVVILSIIPEGEAMLLHNSRGLIPLIIGATVTCNLFVYAPWTQAGWNPARDFGPRLVTYMAGWGAAAIPGPRNGFWIYIVGPCIGTVLGGAFHDFCLAFSIRKPFRRNFDKDYHVGHCD